MHRLATECSNLVTSTHTLVIQLNIAVLHLIRECIRLFSLSLIKLFKYLRDSSGDDTHSLVAFCLDIDVVRARVEVSIS